MLPGIRLVVCCNGLYGSGFPTKEILLKDAAQPQPHEKSHVFVPQKGLIHLKTNNYIVKVTGLVLMYLGNLRQGIEKFPFKFMFL